MIIDYKKNKLISIAFLGSKGSYSHLAAKKYVRFNFSKMLEFSCQKFIDIINLTEIGIVDYGILPIENSNSGIINEVYDLLQEITSYLVGEIFMSVNHYIMTTNYHTKLNSIETIYTHPQPFQQCSNFFKNFPQWNIKYCESTTAAVEKTIKRNSNNVAVLCSVQGNKLYGLNILNKHLANKQFNITRFIILSKKKIKIDNQRLSKITITVITKKNSDIFIKIKFILLTNNILIVKYASRPFVKNLNFKMLYFDIKANLKNKKIQHILEKIRLISPTLKILGCYPIGLNF